MKLGSDPEYFLLKNKRPLAICGMLNGADKWNPFQYPDLPAGFNVQEDNVAVEFGIPPAKSAKEFAANLRTVRERFLKDHPGLAFSGLSAIKFPKAQLKHPMAHIFGCEPDFNAWTKEQNPKPAAADPQLRSAGGHIHVETQFDPYAVGRAMDIFLGIPSTLMDQGEERKKLYGKHGAIRVKPYGVEYRVLSNYWTFQDSTVEWVWRNTERALASVENGESWFDYHELVEQIIDKGDKQAARDFAQFLELEVL